MHREAAGGRFRCLDQIFRQLLEPCGLPVQNIHIFLCLFRLNILFFQQIDVIDNGCKRRLDIVGDVRDELRFHALSPCLLVNGLLDAKLDALQVFLMLFERRQPAGDGLALVIGLAVGNGLSFLLQKPQTGGQI